MGEHSRYYVPGEDLSNSPALKNKLDIKDTKQLADVETLLLADSYTYFMGLLELGEITFDLSLLYGIHTYFLDTLYSWAGKLRTVNISKGGVLFVPVEFLQKEIQNFETYLSVNIPQVKDAKRILSQKLAVIHIELNVIHPFREGSGRTIRLFLDLMAWDAGYEFIDYSKTQQKYYIDACIKGIHKDYEPMRKIMYRGLKKRI